MKILFLDSPAFAKQDMLGAFGECGITCDLFFHNAYHDRKNTDFDNAFDAAVESNSYDFVFHLTISLFYPIIAKDTVSNMYLMFMTVLWWLYIPVLS